MGELLLGESGDLADPMQGMDFGRNPGGPTGFLIDHLTNNACIYYIVNMLRGRIFQLQGMATTEFSKRVW